jgi:hypothetical protein
MRSICAFLCVLGGLAVNNLSLLAIRREIFYSELQAERTPPFQGCAFFYSPLRETVPNSGAVFYFGVNQEVES